jgi:hypothetical protein
LIKFLQKLAVVEAKNSNIFAKFFGENIFKIIALVPGMLGNYLPETEKFIKRPPGA